MTDRGVKSGWRGVGYRLQVVFIGGVLLTAVGFKTSHHLTHPFLDHPWYSGPEIVLEWLLACWLLSGIAAQWARRATLLLFSGFILFLLYQLYEGADSCGCLGAIEISPVYTLIFDSILIAGLLIFKPALRNMAPHRFSSMRRMGSVTVGLCGIAVLSFVLSRDPMRDQSIDPLGSASNNSAATTETTANRVTGPLPKEMVSELGSIDLGSSHPLSFMISNRTGRDVVIKRIASKCKCIRLQSPPSRLPAWQSTHVNVIFEAPQEVTDYTKVVELTTDDTTTPMIRLIVKAAIGKYLEVKPRVVQLSVVGGASSDGSVTVLNHGKKSVRLIYATSKDPSVIAQIPREPIEPGEQLVVPIMASKPASNKARTIPISIHTSSPAQPTIQVQVKLSS